MALRVRISEATEGPIGYGVGDSARDVQGREGVQALDAPRGLIADARDAGSVAGEVLVVDPLDRRLPDRLLRLAYTARRFDARDRGDEGRAGDPEARRHLTRPLVLYNAG